MALVDSGMKDLGFRRAMESLRRQIRPDDDRVEVAPGHKGSAIERWELASALGDESATARAEREMAQVRLDAQVITPEPEPANPVMHYAKEVAALRAAVAELQQPRKRSKFWRKTLDPSTWR